MKSVDRYVYPGTDILINKFECRDANKLKEMEEYKDYQSRLTDGLLILSKDD